jgi:hypothetical protein
MAPLANRSPHLSSCGRAWVTPLSGEITLDQKERQVIDELFGKLQQLDRQSPQRDAEAEEHIRRQVATLPAAPYYMAQAILVQEQALGTLQSRVQELERDAAARPAGGGFLGGLSVPPSPRPDGLRRRPSKGRSRRNISRPVRAARPARPGAARPAAASWPAPCRRPWAWPAV